MPAKGAKIVPHGLTIATPDPLGLPVIGRCEEGEGVVTLHAGEPYDLPGYQRFV